MKNQKTMAEIIAEVAEDNTSATSNVATTFAFTRWSENVKVSSKGYGKKDRKNNKVI